jgi:nitrile hydratase subunit beta
LSDYQSHADLGGMPERGRVVPEREGDLFHAAWEPQAFALTLAMGASGSWNLDMGRSARETLPDYAQLSYYQIWIGGLQKLLVERGLAGQDEIDAGRMQRPPKPVSRVLAAADVPRALRMGAPTERPASTPARFSVGHRVRTRAGETEHHTRLPRYARGKLGQVERVHGAHVFADTHAQGLGEQPQWLYTVVFDARELWGGEAAPGLFVSIDAWESYLEALA